MSTKTTTMTVYPNLRYRDAEAAIGRLERTLGFDRGEVNRDDDSKVIHAEVSLGSAFVMLGTAGAGREPFRSLPAGGTLVYRALHGLRAFGPYRPVPFRGSER